MVKTGTFTSPNSVITMLEAADLKLDDRHLAGTRAAKAIVMLQEVADRTMAGLRRGDVSEKLGGLDVL